MIVVDASVIVSALVATDVHHESSRAWFAAQLETNATLVAPILLLVEVGAAIARRTHDGGFAAAAVRQIKGIPRLQLLPVESELTRHATRLAIELRLRVADAIYIAVAERLGLPLASWDDEHHRRAGERIAVTFPKLA